MIDPRELDAESAELLPGREALGKLSFSFTKGSPLMQFVGFNGGTAFEDDCATNEVLIGYDGRSGAWLDAIQAICAPLVTVYK